jgi:hypothetical protein
MSQFTLTINFTDQGLNTLSSASKKVAMMQAAPNSNYQVVALLAQPQQKMTITWQDTTSVYTSSSNPIKPYTVLQINNTKHATTGHSYVYDGVLITDEGQGLGGSVQLTNKASSTITAGLAINFTVDTKIQDPAILTADSLPYNGLGTFPINCSFYLTTLSDDLSVGYVIPTGAIPNAYIVVQPALLIDFSINQTQAVRFDDSSNEFVLCS